MQHGICLRHVAYCHASATGLLIIDVNLRNSLLIGKCKKSRSWAKSTSEKSALEMPLRKLGPQNFHKMSPMNVSEMFSNFRKLALTVFCRAQKNYRWGPIRPPPPVIGLKVLAFNSKSFRKVVTVSISLSSSM